MPRRIKYQHTPGDGWNDLTKDVKSYALRSRSCFLNFSSVNILGQIILYCKVHCRMLSCNPGLNQLDASSTAPPSCDRHSQMSPWGMEEVRGGANCPQLRTTTDLDNDQSEISESKETGILSYHQALLFEVIRQFYVLNLYIRYPYFINSSNNY